MNTNGRRVVVTGMGAVSPIGSTLESIWDSVLHGKSGIGPITLIPPSEQTCQIAGEVKNFQPELYMDKKESRRMDRFTQFCIAAAKMAFDDSGLVKGEYDGERMGVVLGSGVGGINTINEQLRLCLEKGFSKCSPFLVPMIIADISPGRVSIEYGAKGPNMAIVTACATGGDSIGEGIRWLQHGEADIVIAGGSEAPITPLSVAGFSNMRAMTTRYDEPTKASRPFDTGRDGFVIAEGAGVMVLETLEHAQKRGARIHAEFIGYGRSSDANDIVAPCADGDGAARAMKNALADAGIPASDVQYVNAHGTSTPLGDIAETIAIKRIFGDYAKNGLAVSSTKSMHGHLLGGTGALEAIICALALQNQILPPTINLEDQDPQCDLDYVPNQARPVSGLKVAMSNSFGFGGHNATLILKKFEG